MSGSVLKWHRLLGIMLTDYFHGSGYEVIPEEELSLKQQFLAVAVVRKTKETGLKKICDGLENLNDHNLITFKSHRESLNEWSIQELIGHFVNYGKSRKLKTTRERNGVNLYAVSARKPERLFRSCLREKIDEEIYEIWAGGKKIRVIVTPLTRTRNNEIWSFFSARRERVAEARAKYEYDINEITNYVNGFTSFFTKEEDGMYTVEDFKREVALETLTLLKPEERLSGLKPEDIEAYLAKIKKGKKPR